MTTRPTAVVSGLGPNGALAVLQLLRSGFDVVAAEQRPRHERPIHVGVRRSWLDAVGAVSAGDGDLLRRVTATTSPIAHSERRGPHGDETTTTVDEAASGATADRLRAAPIVHARIDELERAFAAHLDALARDGGRLTLRRGRRVVVVPGAGGRSTVELIDENGAPPILLAPDLVVIAEGGKSVNARRLDVRAVKLSPPRHYLSVHVRTPIGPITRRVDGEAGSCWATGHADPAKGTWIVVETAAPAASLGRDAFDEAAFVVGARRLLDASAGLDQGPLAAIDHPFRGTFRFEQQLLLRPAFGDDVVFFGDCAGMGHHAHCSGLELGACDAAALAILAADLAGGGARRAAVDAYAAAVRRSRVELAAFGLAEYDPALTRCGAAEVEAVVDEAARDPAFEPDRALVERMRTARRAP